ncbi:alpha/beta fold hydrolase [Paracoccus sp. S-4012]|uniref:alpha/beta fold hydrolase n=1 Tax=Paracoccus sp. S-4012 TaxID=2665648 RepID=UPI0012B0A85E|nr:alpha/beta hydrolase [Paracoccus sp. S-4012]MRX49214.1 alpha/beta fold hydrolase [Paracoccus sp. S-4012]
MTRHFTAADGARLAYRDEGEGLPVLALSGLTRTMDDFQYLLPHLPDGVRLIRMDYRGRGESDRTGAATYTVPQEGRDTLALLDHLGVTKAAVLGTSRGGLIGMMLAAVAKDRMLGLCLNDVGPVVDRKGLEAIFAYVGRNPAAKTHEAVAERMAETMTGFSDVPEGRWLDEARLHYRGGPDGMSITYDPALREAFMAAFEGEQPDLWPLFDTAQGLPLALIRGANSDLLSEATAAEMRRRRPDMIFAEVPGRGHIPFLDEPVAVAAIRAWLVACGL